MKILIAEDSPVDALLLRNIMARAGFVPLLAADGEGALEVLGQHPEIGLALVDICLPGMSGIQLVQAIRADPLASDLAVIFASGVSEAETVYQAAALRPQGYILKPFTEPSLVRARVEAVAAQVPAVLAGDEQIRMATGLDPAGVRALKEQLGERLHRVMEAGGMSPQEQGSLAGLGHQVGARRFLRALEEQGAGGGVGQRLNREIRALLNCLAAA